MFIPNNMMIYNINTNYQKKHAENSNSNKIKCQHNLMEAHLLGNIILKIGFIVNMNYIKSVTS